MGEAVPWEGCLRSVILSQGAISSLRGHLAISRDIYDCLDWGWKDVTGI